jgi:hypothetical protein
LSSQQLTAAVSNFGGLRSFAAHSLTPGTIKDVIAEIRSLTSKPFAMNLWVSMDRHGLREKKAGHTALTDKELHRKTRAGNPQPLAGGVEPGRNGDSTLSVATKTRQKSRDPGRGGWPIGSPAPMGWAKCQSFYLQRRIGFLDLIGRGGF